MMKYAAPIFVVLALLQYTAPSGRPVFVAREQVVAIGDPADCAPNAGSRIFTSNTAICVRESIEQAVSKYLVEPAK